MKKVVVTGSDELLNEGAFLVPNHLSYEELTVLTQTVGVDRVTYLLITGAEYEEDMVKFFSANTLDGLEISPAIHSASQVGEEIQKRIAQKKIVLFVPGKVTTYRGTISSISALVLSYLGSLNVTMTPTYVGIFNDYGYPQRGVEGTEIRLSFSSSLVASGADAVSALWQAWKLEESKAFSTCAGLNKTLGEMVLQGMKNHPKAHFIDGINEKLLPNGTMLGVALAFAQYLKKITSSKRIGVILPAGTGATLANLACLFANKVPVNINFLSSKDSVKSAIRQADLDYFITATPFKVKLTEMSAESLFEWPDDEQLILLDELQKQLKSKIVKWVLAAKMMPAWMLIKMFKLNQPKVTDEAVLLFTSGSSGEPKGVPLTHKNILGNIYQCHSRINLKENDNLLGSLPIFHSFGCTITVWFPLVFGYSVVTYPSPKETKRIADLVHKYQIKLMVTTPTFMSYFVRRIPKEYMSSLEYLIVGAEKLSPDLAMSFKEKFGFYPLEGYGLTETSPVCSVNMPTPHVESGKLVLSSERLTSVGHLVPGLAIRITHPLTKEDIPINECGLLWFKGVNVFNGYLNRPDINAEVMQGGWFNTGDVGRVDEQGFLHIEGRISRFSKVGGEMVPHGQLEQAIMRVFNIDPTLPERSLVVVGIPDGRKGECLVLLSTNKEVPVDLEMAILKNGLKKLNLPNLWMPKHIVHVDAIPELNTGKLDIMRCQEIAQENVKKQS